MPPSASFRAQSMRFAPRARRMRVNNARARPRVGSRERSRGDAVANGATREEKSAWACDEINSLLLAPSPHARVCACARFRLITPDHHLIALAVTCWLLTLRENSESLLNTLFALIVHFARE